jgi:hypothetical protein
VGSRFRRVVSRSIARRVAAPVIVACALAVLPEGEVQAQRVLTVVAHDTSLEAAPTVPSGIITVRLVQKGKIRRELVVHRVPMGTPSEQVVRAAAGRNERWFHQWSFGGPAVPRDSAVDAVATMELRPGRYAIIAYAVDAAGRVKPNDYISRELSAVSASALISARFPVPDVRVRVKDASIEVLGTMRPGQRTMQFENAGARPHEVIVGRLKPGKSVADAQRWTRDGSGDATFVYIGGLTPMSSGMTLQMRLVLQSGVHVVLCPFKGERGTPDNVRGVLTTFRVN